MGDQKSCDIIHFTVLYFCLKECKILNNIYLNKYKHSAIKLSDTLITYRPRVTLYIPLSSDTLNAAVTRLDIPTPLPVGRHHTFRCHATTYIPLSCHTMHSATVRHHTHITGIALQRNVCGVSRLSAALLQCVHSLTLYHGHFTGNLKLLNKSLIEEMYF